MGKILRRLLSAEDAIKNNKEIKLTDEELDAVNGGAIVQVNNGSYWAFSDGPNDDGIISMGMVGYWDKDKAIKLAEQAGWSIESMTAEEFTKKYGITDFDDPTTWRAVL